MLLPTSPAFVACCRSTATRLIVAWPIRTVRVARSLSPIAGATAGFYELAAAGDAPIAEEALRRIAALYRVETELRGQGPEHRRAGRQAQAKPALEAFRPWLEDQLPRVPGKSRLAEALRYPLKHWDGLVHYLADGRLEIDTNIVERTIRPLALSRKNALFAGSDRGAEHWAVIASLVETCKLNGINPHAYLTATLERLVAGHPQGRLDELLPWPHQPQV